MTPMTHQEIVDQAVIVTGNSTWWLVVVTIISAAVTLAAVGAAFYVPAWRDSENVKKERRHQEVRRIAVQRNAQRSFKHLDNFEQCFVVDSKDSSKNIWSYLNTIEVEIELINHYLGSDFGDETYPRDLLIIRQSLYETRDACKRILSNERLINDPFRAGYAKHCVELARERCSEVRNKFKEEPLRAPGSHLNPA